MASFGRQSLARLSSCDERLQRVFLAVVAGWDCTILEGHRGKAAFCLAID